MTVVILLYICKLLSMLQNNSWEANFCNESLFNFQISDAKLVIADGSEASHSYALASSEAANGAELVGSNGKDDILYRYPPSSLQVEEKVFELVSRTRDEGRNLHEGSTEHSRADQDSKNDKDGCMPSLSRESFTKSEQVR